MFSSRIEFRPWMLVAALALVYSLAVTAAQDSVMALVTLGTRFTEGASADADGTEGYDGQFVYFIARDFTGAVPLLDVPAYRFQRILLPLLARLAALGQVDLLPWALLGINLAALAAGTALLEHALASAGTSRWYALGYGLSAAALGAVRLSLPEPLAYALALGGIVVVGRGRVLASAALFALAALAKETTLILALGVGLHLLWTRRWRDAVLFGGVTLAPFVLLQLWLRAEFGAFGIGSGGALATPFEVIPLAGVIRILTEGGLLPFLVLGVLLVPFVLLPTFWGLWMTGRDLAGRRFSLETALLLAAAAVMLFVPFSTYRELLGILRFIAGLQIAVILYAAFTRRRRPLRYSTLWALTSLVLLMSDLLAARPA